MDAGASVRQALAETLTRVGSLSEHAAQLAHSHLDEPVGDAMRGPDEDVRVIHQVLDRLAGELSLAREQVRSVAGERDRLVIALAKERETHEIREREFLAKESDLTLRATELSRQLAEHKTGRVEAAERRITPRDKARISELETLLDSDRATHNAQVAALIQLLTEARAAVELARNDIRAARAQAATISSL